MRRRFQPLVECLEGRLLLAGITDVEPSTSSVAFNETVDVAQSSSADTEQLPQVALRLESLETCNSLVCSFPEGQAWFVSLLGGDSGWTDSSGQIRFNIAKDAKTVLFDVADDQGKLLPPLRVELDGGGSLQNFAWELPSTTLPQSPTNAPFTPSSLHASHTGLSGSDSSSTAGTTLAYADHGGAHSGANVVTHDAHDFDATSGTSGNMSRHNAVTNDRNSLVGANSIATAVGTNSSSAAAATSSGVNGERASSDNADAGMQSGAGHASDLGSTDSALLAGVGRGTANGVSGASGQESQAHESNGDSASYDTVLAEWSGGVRKSHKPAPTTSLLSRLVANADTTLGVASAESIEQPDSPRIAALAHWRGDEPQVVAPLLDNSPLGQLGDSPLDESQLDESQLDEGSSPWVFVGATTLAVACLAGIYHLERKRRSTAASNTDEALTAFAEIAPSR